MTPRRPSLLAVLLVAAALLAVAWYIVTPRRAYTEFIGALSLGDVAGLERDVDYPSLRENFKRDFLLLLRNSPGAQSDTGQKKIDELIDPMVQTAATPAGLGQIVRGFTSTGADSLGLGHSTTFRYGHPGRVDVVLLAAGAPAGEEGIFTFSLVGMKWRLTRVSSGRIKALSGTG